MNPTHYLKSVLAVLLLFSSLGFAQLIDNLTIAFAFDEDQKLDLVYELQCPGNIVEVTALRSTVPVDDVTVRLIDVSKGFSINGTQRTNNDGKVWFVISKSGEYKLINPEKRAYHLTAPMQIIELTLCPEEEEEEPAPEEDNGDEEEVVCPTDECILDDDCGNDEDCVLLESSALPDCEPIRTCETLTGPCGYAENHEWIEYECCDDADCAQGYECTGHICTEIEQEPPPLPPVEPDEPDEPTDVELDMGLIGGVVVAIVVILAALWFFFMKKPAAQ